MPEASFPTDILDGFLLGQPISNRNGVKTCPAIYEESNEHYIVKIISLPAAARSSPPWAWILPFW